MVATRCWKRAIPEVADFLAPVFAAVDDVVFYFQSTLHFPKLDIVGSSPISHSIFSNNLKSIDCSHCASA